MPVSMRHLGLRKGTTQTESKIIMKVRTIIGLRTDHKRLIFHHQKSQAVDNGYGVLSTMSGTHVMSPSGTTSASIQDGTIPESSQTAETALSYASLAPKDVSQVHPEGSSLTAQTTGTGSKLVKSIKTYAQALSFKKGSKPAPTKTISPVSQKVFRHPSRTC